MTRVIIVILLIAAAIGFVHLHGSCDSGNRITLGNVMLLAGCPVSKAKGGA